MGDEGKDLEMELIKTAKKYGIRFTGPNCIGIINAHIKLNASMFIYEGEAGGVGIVSQSGSYITQPLPYFPKLGINLSSAISVGNQSDIDIADCLFYFAEDKNTRAVAAYIEGIGDGEKFIEAAKTVTQKKPVVALYVGGTEVGSRAGRSHTGAVASPDRIIDAVFAQTGIIRVKTVEELFDFAHAFSTQPLPKGDRVAVITHSGGPGVSMADAAVRMGLKVPELSKGLQKALREMVIPTAQVGNPVDLTMDFDARKLYIDVTKKVIESGEIDAILFYGAFGAAHMMKKFKKLGLNDSDKLDQYDEYLKAIIDEFSDLNRNYDIPILAASFSGKEDSIVAKIMEVKIPIYPTPERASVALSAMAKYARFRGLFKD
jgi:acyl-CoA synthetase (NDP forming)